MDLIYVDPITFKIYKYTEDEVKKYREDFIQQIKKEYRNDNNLKIYENLKNVNDIISKYLREENSNNWGKLPSDTRFPGYFSNLSDHTIATTTIGIAIAIESFNRRVRFEDEYTSEIIKDLLKNKESFLQIIRFACLLHDIGKYPIVNHDIRSREIIESLLREINFNNDIINFLAELASRHHFGQSYSSNRRPHTKLEWIIALADKVSVQDRVLSNMEMLRDNLIEPFEWLKKHDDNPDNKEKIKDLINYIKNQDRVNIDYINTILPLDQQKNIQLNKKLLDTANLFDLEDSLEVAILICEGKSIQNFIRRSEKRKYLTGASSLVASGFNEIKKLIEKTLAPESVIYTSSGSLLAIVPLSELDNLKEEIVKKIEEVVKGGIGLNLPLKDTAKFNLYVLKSGPIYAWRNKNSISRRNFGELYNIVINFSEIYGVSEKEPKIFGINDICTVCYNNKAIEDINSLKDTTSLNLYENEKICELCYHVLNHENHITDSMVGILFEVENNNIKFIDLHNHNLQYYAESSPIYQILPRFKEILKSQLLEKRDLVEKLNGKKVFFKYEKNFDNLGKVSKNLFDYENNSSEIASEVYDVAYIKGDGDNFGSIKSSMPNITLYRKISEIFKKIISDLLLNSLSKILIFQLEVELNKNFEKSSMINLNIPFYIIYYSGDDFFIVIDAGFTFLLLNNFQQEIKKYLGGPSDEYNKNDSENLSIFKLGISLGCLICKNRAPIYLALEALNELEKLAKMKSKKMRKKYGGEICVALQKFDIIPNNISIKNRYSNDNFKIIKLTQFPLLSNELNAYLEDLKIFIDNNITPNDLLNVIKIKDELDNPNSIKRLKLEIKFKEARNINQDEKLFKKYGIIYSKIFFKNDKKLILRHEDFIDSLKIIYNSDKLLN
ncbi:MAG: Cas10/Cmr2 second palm domain-containing protein [Candidatus Helarchaeota archaeon]